MKKHIVYMKKHIHRAYRNIMLRSNKTDLFLNLYIVFLLQVTVMVYLLSPRKDIEPDKSLKKDHAGHDSVAKNASVLCFIKTCPGNLDKRVTHIANTWARKCDKVIYVSGKENTSFPTVNVTVPLGRAGLVNKTFKGFDFIYKHHFKYDWFLHIDDDAYVAMDNLRYLLNNYDPNLPIFVGQIRNVHNHTMWMDGGSGFVLSKESLRRFGNRNTNACNENIQKGLDDILISQCLIAHGVKLVDGFDAMHKTRLHAESTNEMMHDEIPFLRRRFIERVHRLKALPASLSDYAISFHHLDPMEFYDLEYYIYKLRPYGIPNTNKHLNLKQSESYTSIPYKAWQFIKGKLFNIPGMVTEENNFEL